MDSKDGNDSHAHNSWSSDISRGICELVVWGLKKHMHYQITKKPSHCVFWETKDIHKTQHENSDKLQYKQSRETPKNLNIPN